MHRNHAIELVYGYTLLGIRHFVVEEKIILTLVPKALIRLEILDAQKIA